MNRLFQSSKFWTAVIDVVVSLILYFASKYADASLAEDIKVVILAIQPVFISVIAAIAYEDGQEKGAKTSSQLPENTYLLHVSPEAIETIKNQSE